MKSFLISFLWKLSDHEVLTTITFIIKYYPKDNEFTDKFSLLLDSGLRRINLVRILEELKSFRYTTQWIHHIYNRLLALVEDDSLTFDNWFKILINKLILKRRDRTIIRAVCYHLFKKVAMCTQCMTASIRQLMTTGAMKSIPGDARRMPEDAISISWMP